MIEVLKITHDLYHPDVSLNLAYSTFAVNKRVYIIRAL